MLSYALVYTPCVLQLVLAGFHCRSDILHEMHQKGELKQLLEGVKQAED
jgi:glutaredoxin-related protein